MRIQFPVFGNLNLCHALKRVGVSLLYSHNTQTVIATFDDAQEHLYECTKTIISRQVARKVGLQKQA